MSAASLARGNDRGIYDSFVNRLCALGDANAVSRSQVERVLQPTVALGSRVDLLSDRQQRLTAPVVVLDGYVADMRLLADGRRQIMRLTLPGEIIVTPQTVRASRDTVSTLSDVVLAPLDMSTIAANSTLATALSRSAALGQSELFNQITRLGRQSALERTGHLLLELHDRLKLAGLTRHWWFELRLTQETLSDILGLTSVHMNRTLQQLRKERLVDIDRHSVFIRNPTMLAQISDYAVRPFSTPDSE